MSKTSDEFLDHFARLGVFSKVQALILSDQSNEVQPPMLNSPTINATIPTASANELPLQNVSSTTQHQSQTTGNAIYNIFMSHNNCFRIDYTKFAKKKKLIIIMKNKCDCNRL